MNYNNEETVFEQSAQSEETVMNESVNTQESSENVSGDNASESEAAEQPEKQKKSWKEVTIGGASGIAIGAAGILLSGFTLPEEATIPGILGNDDNHEENNGNATPEADIQDNPIHVATGVNDEMSFGEAFAAARQEVGANGAFVWHGQVYTTCYAEEWNAMSESEQAQFSHNAVAAANGEHQQATASSTDTTDTTQEESHATDGGDTTDDGIEVSVLGVEENVITEDGDVINVGYADIEGHSAIFIDTDADGTFDILASDINDDGYIDVESEVAEISEENITVEDFHSASVTDPVDDLYAQAPDYTNDADTSSFA